MSDRLERGHITLLPLATLSITQSTNNAIHLDTRHFHMLAFSHFHGQPVRTNVGLNMLLICGNILWLRIGVDFQITR